MKNNSYTLKVKRINRSLRVVFQGFFWATIIATLGLLIGAILIQFWFDDALVIKEANGGGFVLSMDSLIRYRLDQSNIGVSTKPVYKVITWVAALCSLGLSIVFKQLVNLLRTVEQDKPFAKENANRLNVIGVVLILGSVLVRIAGGMVATTIIETFNITNIDVNVSIDIFMALSGFMMLILGGIFKYGNYLQEEYDSTL